MPDQEMKVNNVWGSIDSEMLKLPSGQVIKARRMSPEDILESGIISGGDPLSSVILAEQVASARTQLQGHLPKKEGRSRSEEDILKDPEMIRQAFYFMDRVLPIVVLDPPVALHLEPTEDGKSTRKLSTEDRVRRIQDGEVPPNVVWTDQIGVSDKMYIFQWSLDGGLPEVDSFPGSQHSADVGALADGAEVPVSAVQPVRTNKRRNRRR